MGELNRNARRGASVTGYALLVGLISVVGLSAINSVGDSTNGLFTEVGSTMDEVTTGTLTTPTPASPTPTPSASASPVYVTAQYWRVTSVGSGYNGGLNSATEMILTRDNDGSVMNDPGLSLIDNGSVGCSGSLNNLKNAVVYVTNQGFYACTSWDIVVDMGTPREVTEIKLYPQGINPSHPSGSAGAECYNFPSQLNIYAASSASGPWGSPVKVVTVASPPANGCPEGIYPTAEEFRRAF